MEAVRRQGLKVAVLYVNFQKPMRIGACSPLRKSNYFLTKMAETIDECLQLSYNTHETGVE